VNFYTDLPESSITEAEVTIHKTFLDTLGRKTLVIKARNLVDDLRDRQLLVSYDYSFLASLRKPFVIFASMISIFVGIWLLGSVNMTFSSKKRV
jgi:oligosaccharyltransferase complex subunit alpha (ribophorin I)